MLLILAELPKPAMEDLLSTTCFLQWDSDFFGFSVVEIRLQSLDSASVAELLDEQNTKGVHLVYFRFTDRELFEAVKTYSCPTYLDCRISFAKSLSVSQSVGHQNCTTRDYKQDDLAALYELAKVAGQYSRFRLDPNFNPDEFSRLYQVWIDNSVACKFCDKIIVAEKDGLVCGMVTMAKSTEDKASIQLIAVHPNFRGLKIGSELIHAAESWCHSKGLEKIEVLTQAENSRAVEFYNNNGFKSVLTDYIAHVWLNPRYSEP